MKEYDRLARLEDACWGEKAGAAEAEGYLGETETSEFVGAALRAEGCGGIQKAKRGADCLSVPLCLEWQSQPFR
jgi:hypothetical protein